MKLTLVEALQLNRKLIRLIMEVPIHGEHRVSVEEGQCLCSQCQWYRDWQALKQTSEAQIALRNS